MQCNKCGKELTLEEKKCPVCGNELVVDTPPVAGVMPKEEKEEFSVPLTSEPEEVVPRPVFEEEKKEESAPEAVVAPVEEVAPTPVETPAPAPEPTFVSPVALAPPVGNEAPAPAAPVETNTYVVSDTTTQPSALQPVQEETLAPAAPAIQEEERVEPVDLIKAVQSDKEANIQDNSDIMVERQVYDVHTIQDSETVKKSVPVPLIIGLVLAFSVIFGGIGIFAGSVLFANKEQKQETPQVEEIKTTSVIFSGNKFEIPNDYDYEIKEGKLSIYDENIYYYVQVAPSSYAQYSSNIPFIKNNYTNLGYKVESAQEMNVLQSKYVVLNLIKATGEKVTLFLRSFTTNQSFVCAVGLNDGRFATKDDLIKIEKILQTKTLIASKAFEQEDEVKDDEILGVIINSQMPEAKEEEPQEEVKEEDKESKDEDK